MEGVVCDTKSRHWIWDMGQLGEDFANSFNLLGKHMGSME